MEVIIASIFSAIIIFMTTSSIIRALFIARKREEITFRKLIFFAALSIAIGLVIVSILPFVYQKLLGAVGM